LIPLYDENPTVNRPYVTLSIVALNALAWIFLQGMGSQEGLLRSMCQFALIPGDLLHTVSRETIVALAPGFGCALDGTGTLYTPITAMFMHGGWFHIIGNMWFLWVFGDNVEDIMGPVRFVIFYLICGLAAAFAQVITDVDSVVPMVGASGAIGGVMGAYARMFPKARVNLLIFFGFYITTIAVPAVYMLGYWFLLQLLGGLPSVGAAGGGVAFWAHIGGFVAGLLLVKPFARKDFMEARERQERKRRAARHQLNWPYRDR